MLGVRVLRSADGDHLDLGKLVLADQAARIPPRRPRLGPETGRQRRQAHRLRHLVLAQNLLAHEVGQGDFGGGDQVALIASFALRQEGQNLVIVPTLDLRGVGRETRSSLRSFKFTGPAGKLTHDLTDALDLPFNKVRFQARNPACRRSEKIIFKLG
ncbi:hypothetical protein D3C72_1141220 [compost metagenome]